jgi:magnesium transporter
MISAYRIEPAQLVACGIDNAHILLTSEVTDADKDYLLRETGLEPADLESIADADEVPRVENTRDGIFVIWKQPDNVSRGDTVQFEVSSLGIVISQNRAFFIVARGEMPHTGREFRRVQSVADYVLGVLLHTIHHYQGHLKVIKMMSQELQAKVVTAMENRYLLQMFTLGESLVYYHNALEANLAVLGRLRASPDKLKLTGDQLALLDDIIVENQQAAKQASIYSTVLSGLMDARGTIINNNMNVLLTNLTIINVVFLPLNLIASIFGMSEWSEITRAFDWRVSYGVFVVAMLILGWITWRWLLRVIHRRQGLIAGRSIARK